MLKIDIKTIKQEDHRYQTLGDYWDDEEGTHIRVTNLKSPDSEFLVALHELIEQYLLKVAGIKEPDVMAFDIMFEKERADGKWDEYAEPGDDPRAPYRKQHFFAECIERLVAGFIGVDWKQHCEYQQYEEPEKTELPFGAT
jgi:hypothetical protein